MNEEEQSKGSFEPDEIDKKTETNIVASLAEKAMSVASPVVPMKEDGGVDHERFGLFTSSHINAWSLSCFLCGQNVDC